MVLSDRKTVEVSWVSDMGANSKVIIPDKVTYKVENILLQPSGEGRSLYVTA